MSFTSFSLALAITAVTLVGLAGVAWRRRGATRGARSFTFFMLTAAVWAAFEALQAASAADPALALTWRQLKYVGIAGLPVAYLVFANDYTRAAAWLDRFVVAGLVVVSATTVGLTWTNELHGLMWTEGPGAPSDPLLALAGRGGWFWVHTAFSYALIALASFYLLRGYVRTPRPYRGQLGWVLAAVLVPWVANVVVLATDLDTGGIDVTPLTFALSAFAFARSLFSHRLLDIVPVAQESVVRSLTDAVIVVDERGRTLQLNPSAAALLGVADVDAAVGAPLGQLLERSPSLAEAMRQGGEQRIDVTFEGARGARVRTFEAQITPLTDKRGRETGRLVRLQDIDRQVQAERTLALAETTLRQQETYVLALQEVTEGLMRRAPLGTLLDGVMRHAGDVLGAPHGFLDLVDADEGVTARERARGRFQGLPDSRVRPGEGLAGRVWATRGPLRVDDYARWEGRLHGGDFDWIRAAVGAPLASREGVHGVLVVARDRDDRRPFDAADEAELARFAELAALAVLNVRTIDELDARRSESEQLARIGTAMQEAVSVEERMALVLRAIPQVVGLTRAVIWLPDQARTSLKASAWVGFDDADGVRVPLDGSVPLLQAAFEQARESVVDVHDVLPASLRARAPFKHHPLVRSRAAVVLPLVARGDVVGVLAADSPAEGQPVAGALGVLRRFATNAALAIDAATLLSTAQAEVAERRAAEAELRRSEEKYRGILEQIQEAYFEVDLAGRFTMVNPALTRSVGATPAAMLGRTFRRYVEASDVRRVVGLFAEVARSGEPMTGVALRYRGTSGRPPQRAELSVTLVRDRGGTPVGFRGVLRDVEERMRYQEELQAAKDAAEAANAAKSVFLANVSHELRTPLTSILGFARLIERRFDEVLAPRLEGVDDPKVRRAVEQVRGNAGIISRESRRLTTLINDVLDLAKIEAGKVDWNMERLAPRSVVEQALDATRGLLEAKPQVTIRTELHDVADVIGDRDRLVQVVINLISNAVKFTPEGEVTLTLDRPGDQVRVAVHDTGVGIAPEDHAAVFEQFRQVGDTLTEKPQGTGLGLPICKQIVEHHGGRLWVESALGEGATFAFSLPALTPLAGATPAASAPLAALEASVQLRRHVERVLAAARDAGGGFGALSLEQLGRRAADGAAEGAAGAPHTVLVVDDDPQVRSLLRQALEEAGHRVVEAGDGASALRMVREQRPDLVTLDVMMPHLSGFDVAAALKGDPATSAIPIVILTVVEDAQRGYRLGVERYLTKPVDVGALVADVGALLAPAEAPGGALGDVAVALVEDPDADAGERALVFRAEAALASSGYRVRRVASTDAAAELDPPPVVVVLSRAVAERGGGLARVRADPRLADAVVVVGA